MTTQPTDPIPFNLPVDKIFLVLDLVASWQIDQILSAPLLPLFDPKSKKYILRNRFQDDPADDPDPYDDDPPPEQGRRLNPGRVYGKDVYYGSGDRPNPAFPLGYGYYRHVWEMQMDRDAGVSQSLL